MFDILKKEGLTVEYTDSFATVLSGFLDAKKKVIFVNKNNTLEQQKFTIAHELGHYMLGHQRLEDEADEYAKKILNV